MGTGDISPIFAQHFRQNFAPGCNEAWQEEHIISGDAEGSSSDISMVSTVSCFGTLEGAGPFFFDFPAFLVTYLITFCFTSDVAPDTADSTTFCPATGSIPPTTVFHSAGGMKKSRVAAFTADLTSSAVLALIQPLRLWMRLSRLFRVLFRPFWFPVTERERSGCHNSGSNVHHRCLLIHIANRNVYLYGP